MELIQYQVKNRVAEIILNRPEKRNAFNAQLVLELKEALENAEKDEAVRLILLRANGKVFSAGADLGYLQTMMAYTEEQNIADSKALADLFKYIYEHPKVTIAQIEGHAIAGGCGLATVCDFSFIVPEAMMGYSEVKIGFIPAIVMVFLLRKIGEGKAKELLLTGKLLNGIQAAEYGLVTKVIEADKIQDYVSNFMERLCVECSGDAMALTKQMIAKVQSMTLEDGLDFAAKMNAKARNTKDCKAGIAAFLNKEKMMW
jgi:methylglutaconyl-CoA hydratase